MNEKALRILLVENDSYQCESMVKTLEEYAPACQIEIASAWSETLRKLMENEYDLLLLDYDLPQREGLGMLHRIQRKGYPTPVVIIIEPGQEEVAVYAMQDGVFDCLIRTEGYLTILPLVVSRALERQHLLDECRSKETGIQERDRQMAALNIISEAAGQVLDLGQILDRALSKVMEVTGARAGGIYIIDELTGELFPFVQRGLTYSFAQMTAGLKRSENLARQVVQLGTSHLAENVSGTLEGAEEAVFSLVCVLLKSKGQALGVMNLFMPVERSPDPRQMELLITAANQMGLAVENARLHEGSSEHLIKLEKSNQILRELNVLLEENQAQLEGQLAVQQQAAAEATRSALLPADRGILALSITTSLELDQVLDEALKRALEATTADAAGVFLLDREERELSLAAERDLPQSFVQTQARMSADESALAQTSLVENIAEDAAARKIWAEAERKGLRSLLSAPLRAEDELVGMISVLARGQGHFTSEEAELLSVLGQQCGLAIRNTQLYQATRLQVEKLEASNAMLQAANIRLQGSQEELESLLGAMMEAETEIQQYYKELWTLNSIAATISGSLNLDEILNSAVSKMTDIMEVEAGWVYLLDEHDHMLKLRAYHGLPGEVAQGLAAVRLGEDLNELVARSGESILIEDISADPRFTRVTSTTEAFSSLAAVPLKAKDLMLGVMGVTSSRYRQFTPREVQLLTSIGYQVAVAIENARLYDKARQSAEELERGNEVLQEVNVLLEESQAELEEQITALKKAEAEIQQRNSELSALNAIAQTLNQSLDVEKVSGDALDTMLQTMQLTYGEFFLFNEATSEVSLLVHRGMPPAFAFEIKNFGLGEGVPGMVAQTKQPLVIEDLRQDIRFIRGLREEGEGEEKSQPYTVIGVPLLAQDRLVGAMDFFSTEERRFTPQDLSLLTTISHQIGVAVQNARLFEEVKEAAARLERANEELQELNRLKSDFIATVSHELRTPLASIMGYVDLMQDQETGPLNEEQTKYIEIIERNTDRLSRLINDILDISRIEAGRIDLVMTTIKLGDIVQDVALTMRPQAQAKGLGLNIAVADELPATQGDPDRIKQVAVNLLSNAIKFTSHGGRVDVHCYGIRVEEGHVELLTTGPYPPNRSLALGEGDWLLTQVIDTGMGIPKEALDRIFEKFYQVRDETARRVEGSGLGLSIAEGIVKAHGGEMWAESPGQRQGATFTFALPIVESEPRPVYEEILAPATGLGTLLVVDDDPDIVNLVRLYLESEGYSVVTAYGGEDALHAAEEVKPTAIVLDLLMPDLDGFAVLEKLKSNPATRDTPVIIISILSDKEKGFSLGAVDYLTKPIDRRRLIASVQKLILPIGQEDQLAPILVVDDDREIAGLVEAYLQGEGFAVTCAYDGLEALDRIREEIPSLIVLDILMPGMDGFQVIQALKANSVTRMIPVIILTAKDLSEEERASLQLGATKYLTKTLFSKERLLTEVRDLLGKLYRE